MKVLVIPTWYPSGEDKLMGIYHKEFTHALNKYGVNADMLYVEKRRLSKPFEYIFMKKKEIIEEDNYKVYIYRTMNMEPISAKWQFKRYVKAIEKSFKKYIRVNGKPDVIHAMCTVPVGYAACLIGEKYNIPVVITEHGGALGKFLERDEIRDYGLYALNHSVYSVVSTYMTKFVEKYKKECYVLPNQVDTYVYKNDVKRKVNGTFRLVMLCAIRQAKRLDIAFKAIRILIDKGIDIHLDIIGDGFYERIYKQECTKDKLDDYVTFLGRKDKKEIAKIFESENALLISSELESFAIPGIEALASGLPVISTDCGGPRDFINDKTGVLAKVNDPKNIANGISYVIDNYKKFKKADLEKMANSFSEENVVKKAQGLYNIAVKSKKRKISE